MRAMLLKKPNSIENHPLVYQEIATPSISDDEILLRLDACGVCHTDLHIAEGDLLHPKLPLILGHEVIGHVEKLGKNVTNVGLHDRVGVAWLFSSCGKCKYCIRGQENLCESAKFTGYTADGGYAEYMKATKDFVYLVPKSFSSENAAPLMCAGVIGFRSLRMSDLRPGETLGLFGFGASAHIVIQIAKQWDCPTYVFTRSKNHQNHALELGADWVGTSKDIPPKKIDRAIMFAPVGEIVLDVLRVLDRGGTCAINAIHLSDIPPISWDLLWHERKIISIANVVRQDALDFLKIAEKIKISTDIVEYSLNDANKALIDLKNSRFNGAAVLKF